MNDLDWLIATISIMQTRIAYMKARSISNAHIEIEKAANALEKAQLQLEKAKEKQ